jgi:probable DNA repair protein
LVYATPIPPARLSLWQELSLWERVIRESPRSGEILQLQATAAAAQEAWARAIEWRLELSRIEGEGNEDCRAFAAWVRRFRQICEAEGWQERSRSADCLAAELGTLRLPPDVLLAGFDQFTPQQVDFLNACAAAGCRTTALDFTDAPAQANAVRVSFADAEQEITAAARWSRALLERAPGVTIGVVLTDLEARRDAVERIFRAILEPASQLPGSQKASSAFNISAGRALTREPMIRTAFDILALSPEHNDWNRISALLRTPYLGGAAEERTARALLDARLREDSDVVASFSRLRQACRETPACPLLARLLGAWARLREAAAARQTCGKWGQAFSAWLRAAGWPGEQALNSVEYQVLRAWEDVLSHFAATSLVGGDLSLSEAVALLERIAAQTLFQPESGPAPVQILGVLEASGLGFDHLWVAGLDDDAWPAAPKPNPFLPIRLQREAGLPRCSPERELEFAGLVTARLLGSSPNVILSCAIQSEDAQLLPSPLIRHVPEISPDALQLWNGATFVELVRQSRSIESLVDERGPALGPDAWQRGGTKVFQYQSLCPFRAFAELRMGAEDLASPAPGLDARQRGILVHSALEEIWKELKTHQALCSTTDLARRIGDVARSAISRFEQERGAPLPPRFAALERERLERLIEEWLEYEKRRAPFEVVQPEGEALVEVSGIRCKVKIDRIDRLDDGRELIIDYKTGKASTSDWESDRPAAPQLPLYSTVHRSPLAGVLFGRVQAGEMRFAGLVESDLQFPGRAVYETDLAAQIQEWRVVLERLGLDFRSGHAAPAPKNPNQQCPGCSLACLCRIADAGNGHQDKEAR